MPTPQVISGPLNFLALSNEAFFKIKTKHYERTIEKIQEENKYINNVAKSCLNDYENLTQDYENVKKNSNDMLLERDAEIKSLKLLISQGQDRPELDLSGDRYTPNCDEVSRPSQDPNANDHYQLLQRINELESM